MDPYEQVTRNTVEVVTDQELRALIDSPVKRVYTGYEPSGEIHLGHMVTVNKLIDMQKAGFEVTVLIADLHAFLNRKGTMEEIREIAEYNRRCFEGLGLLGAKYVLGSDVQLAPEYELNVLKLSQAITLNRARRSMDEVGRQMENPTVSQMVYPIMQMVDIATLGWTPPSAGSTSERFTCSHGNTFPQSGIRRRSASTRRSSAASTGRRCRRRQETSYRSPTLRRISGRR